MFAPVFPPALFPPADFPFPLGAISRQAEIYLRSNPFQIAWNGDVVEGTVEFSRMNFRRQRTITKKKDKALRVMTVVGWVVGGCKALRGACLFVSVWYFFFLFFIFVWSLSCLSGFQRRDLIGPKLQAFVPVGFPTRDCGKTSSSLTETQLIVMTTPQALKPLICRASQVGELWCRLEFHGDRTSFFERRKMQKKRKVPCLIFDIFQPELRVTVAASGDNMASARKVRGGGVMAAASTYKVPAKMRRWEPDEAYYQ